jgi:hypothetical protein
VHVTNYQDAPEIELIAMLLDACSTRIKCSALRAGFALDDVAFEALLVAYDPTHRGSLDMAEFVALTFFMKAASGMFHVFDEHRAGSVTLNFNQFVYACTFCR